MYTHFELTSGARILYLQSTDIVLKEEGDGTKVGVGADTNNFLVLQPFHGDTWARNESVQSVSGCDRADIYLG